MTQETVGKSRVFIVNADSVPIENLGKKGAEKVNVRYLVDERQGSERFALRLYSVEKGVTRHWISISMSIKYTS